MVTWFLRIVTINTDFDVLSWCTFFSIRAGHFEGLSWSNALVTRSQQSRSLSMFVRCRTPTFDNSALISMNLNGWIHRSMNEYMTGLPPLEASTIIFSWFFVCGSGLWFSKRLIPGGRRSKTGKYRVFS